jgi:hypothetical protein
VNFSFEVESATLFSLSGKRVDELPTNNGTVDLSSQKKGVFILSTTDTQGNKNSFRILKE